MQHRVEAAIALLQPAIRQHGCAVELVACRQGVVCIRIRAGEHT